MGLRVCTVVVVLILQLTGSSVFAQEYEFTNLFKNLLEADELKNIQNMYSDLPVELREKLMKDLLENPGKVGNDIVNILGPQEQNLIAGFVGNLGKTNRKRINEALKIWQDFIRSSFGQNLLNRVLPRLLKAESLPDALRLLEKETAFRFDVMLFQLQDPTVRKRLVSQTVKQIGKFFKGITIPNDIKEVLTKAEEILNTKLGLLGVKAKEFIGLTVNYIQDTFKITRESLLDLKAEEVEKMASEVLNNEVLSPLTYVWDAYQKARENAQCAQFIFCQLNHNFSQDNFIKRNVIKISSIVSACHASALLKGKDAFSVLYEAVYKGADGSDCTMGVNSFCLELMTTAAHNHNEL